MIIFNIPGILMLVVAFAIMFGARAVTGTIEDGPGEGPEMIALGSLSILFDTTYRIRQPNGHWISPFGGGNIFFFPIWVLGLIWIMIGSTRWFTHPVPLDVLSLGLLGVLTLVSIALTALQIALVANGAAQANDSSNVRCLACNLPCDADDINAGKCRWCGEPVK